MWIVLSALAFALVVINIMLITKNDYKFSATLVFLSLSCGIATVLWEYNYVSELVLNGKLDKLNSIVNLNGILMGLSLALIILNGVVLFLNVRNTMSK